MFLRSASGCSRAWSPLLWLWPWLWLCRATWITRSPSLPPLKVLTAYSAARVSSKVMTARPDSSWTRSTGPAAAKASVKSDRCNFMPSNFETTTDRASSDWRLACFGGPRAGETAPLADCCRLEGSSLREPPRRSSTSRPRSPRRSSSRRSGYLCESRRRSSGLASTSRLPPAAEPRASPRDAPLLLPSTGTLPPAPRFGGGDGLGVGL